VLRISRRIMWTASIAVVSTGIGLATASSGSVNVDLSSEMSHEAVAQPACNPISLPVAISRFTLKRYTVRGQLCTPGGTAKPDTVQVLIPGATYNHTYWNFPLDPSKYSYVRAMLAAGYATLNFDPLGFGESSHPLSALVTIETEAFVTHRVIQAARNGTFGIKFPHVILVGHSMGTAVAWREAAAYHDINGMIASGNSHHQSLVTTLKTPLITYPAFLDPKFSGQHLDPGYFTTRPGTRIDVFYNPADASPAVVAEDEKTKDTVTLSFLATYFAEDVDLDTSRIHVPVLIAVGQHDALMCKGVGADDCSTSSAFLRSEAPFYAPSACLQAYVLPKAGHDLNLSLNAQSFFQVAKRWAHRWVGASGPVKAHHCDGPVGPAF
jgi:pimeloyl-ACP methyl ester carboxylesterase